MKANIILAATAIALLAGTAAASAQSNIAIQSRDFRQSNGIYPSHRGHWRGYRGHSAYGYARGYYGPRYRYGYWRW